MTGRSNAVSGGGFTNSLKIINNTNYKFPLEANPGEFVNSEPSAERLELSISTTSGKEVPYKANKDSGSFVLYYVFVMPNEDVTIEEVTIA